MMRAGGHEDSGQCVVCPHDRGGAAVEISFPARIVDLADDENVGLPGRDVKFEIIRVARCPFETRGGDDRSYRWNRWNVGRPFGKNDTVFGVERGIFQAEHLSGLIGYDLNA